MSANLFLAPLVIAQRLPVIWLEAWGLGRGGGQPETTRMVHEKLAATMEGTVAMSLEWQKLAVETSLALISGRAAPSPVSGGQRLTKAALAPAARRVRLNVRRLSRG